MTEPSAHLFTNTLKDHAELIAR